MKNSQVSNQVIVAIVLNLSSLVVALNFFDPINWPKQIMLLTCTPLLFFVIFSNKKFLNPRNLLRFHATKVWIVSMVLIFLLIILSNSNYTRTLWGTWGRNNGLLTTMALASLWFLMHFLSLQNQTLWPLLRSLAALFCVSASYGLVQALDVDPISWSTTGQVFGLYGNANFASAAWGIGSVLSFGLLMFDKDLGNRWIYIFSMLLMFGATVLTKSLQGILIIVIGVSLIIFSILYKKSRSLGASFIVVFVVCSLISGAGFFGFGPLGTSLSQDTLILRKYYWLAGIEMGRTHPFSGVGVDAYGDNFREFRQLEVASRTGIDLITNNAHGSFIQAFATLGVIGLIAMILPVTLSLFFAIKIMLNRNSERKDLTLISIMSLILWVVANFSIDNISIAVWNWSFLGLIISQKEREYFQSISPEKAKTRSNFSLPWTKYLAYATSMALFSLTWFASSPDRALLEAYKNNSNSDNPLLVNEAKESLLEIADKAFVMETHFRYAAAALKGTNLNDEAISLLIRGHSVYPKDYGILDGLASTLEKLNRREEAVFYREKQVKLEERSPLVWMNLALDYDVLGREIDARVALEQALKYKSFVPIEFSEQFAAAEKVILE